MRHLYALSYSPWSEKARWALDHHRLDYVEHEYVPILGEPALRWAARRPFGRVSVPTLIEDGVPYIDSLVIAKHADEIGKRARLFPDGAIAEIERYNELSEAMLSAAREICVPRMSADAEAAAEAAPPYLPGRRLLARSSVGLAGLFLRTKYKMRADETQSLGTIRGGLVALRAALDDRETLLPTFSYADIVMAVTLQWVAPLPPEIRPVGPALRRILQLPELAEEFADLVAWRDRLYAAHRKPEPA